MVCALYLAEDFLFAVGQPDNPALVGKVAVNVLPNPPGCIGTKPDAFRVVVSFRRVYQSQIPLLNNIKKGYIMGDIRAGDFNHQPQIGIDKPVQGFMVSRLNTPGQLQFFVKIQQGKGFYLVTIGL
jgi:hypothetical protein